MKKEKPNWYIAATHYLTSGFAIPLIIGIVLGIPIFLVLGMEKTSLSTSVGGIISVLSIWLGVIYSSRFISKNYIVKDSNKVIKIATAYYVIFGIISKLIKINKPAGTITLLDFVIFIVLVFTFYYFSKKYISNDIVENQVVEI